MQQAETNSIISRRKLLGSAVPAAAAVAAIAASYPAAVSAAEQQHVNPELVQIVERLGVACEKAAALDELVEKYRGGENRNDPARMKNMDVWLSARKEWQSVLDELASFEAANMAEVIFKAEAIFSLDMSDYRTAIAVVVDLLALSSPREERRCLQVIG